MFPFQALEDQDVVLERCAGGDDVGVDLLHADPAVGHAPVVGDDDPVEAEGGGVHGLVGDPVHPVRAVLGVDVVVSGQPLVAVPGRPSALSS